MFAHEQLCIYILLQMEAIRSDCVDSFIQAEGAVKVLFENVDFYILIKEVEKVKLPQTVESILSLSLALTLLKFQTADHQRVFLDQDECEEARAPNIDNGCSDFVNLSRVTRLVKEKEVEGEDLPASIPLLKKRSSVQSFSPFKKNKKDPQNDQTVDYKKRGKENPDKQTPLNLAGMNDDEGEEVEEVRKKHLIKLQIEQIYRNKIKAKKRRHNLKQDVDSVQQMLDNSGLDKGKATAPLLQQRTIAQRPFNPCKATDPALIRLKYKLEESQLEESQPIIPQQDSQLETQESTRLSQKHQIKTKRRSSLLKLTDKGLQDMISGNTNESTHFTQSQPFELVKVLIKLNGSTGFTSFLQQLRRGVQLKDRNTVLSGEPFKREKQMSAQDYREFINTAMSSSKHSKPNTVIQAKRQKQVQLNSTITSIMGNRHERSRVANDQMARIQQRNQKQKIQSNSITLHQEVDCSLMLLDKSDIQIPSQKGLVYQQRQQQSNCGPQYSHCQTLIDQLKQTRNKKQRQQRANSSLDMSKNKPEYLNSSKIVNQSGQSSMMMHPHYDSHHNYISSVQGLPSLNNSMISRNQMTGDPRRHTQASVSQASGVLQSRLRLQSMQSVSRTRLRSREVK